MFGFDRNLVVRPRIMSWRAEKLGFGVANTIATVCNEGGVSSGVIKSFIELVLNLGGNLGCVIEDVFLPFLTLILLVKDRYVKT